MTPDEPVLPETAYGVAEVTDYVAVQVHTSPPASEPVWHRRFLLVEDKLRQLGHWHGREDHHAIVCPICTVLRRAREVSLAVPRDHEAGDSGR